MIIACIVFNLLQIIRWPIFCLTSFIYSITSIAGRCITERCFRPNLHLPDYHKQLIRWTIMMPTANLYGTQKSRICNETEGHVTKMLSFVLFYFSASYCNPAISPSRPGFLPLSGQEPRMNTSRGTAGDWKHHFQVELILHACLY
jgi:hypothetical protein